VSGLILHLSILQSHVFLLNSRLGLFTAASLRRRPFSRSYRAILPSSLAMIHSSTLGFSPRLPVSVSGTGFQYLKFRGFSWKFVYRNYLRSRSLTVLSPSTSSADLPAKPISTGFNLLFRQQACVSLLRLPITILKSTGILTSYPSGSPFGCPLGPD
jgi:hypothetical protein